MLVRVGLLGFFCITDQIAISITGRPHPRASKQNIASLDHAAPVATRSHPETGPNHHSLRLVSACEISRLTPARALPHLSPVTGAPVIMAVTDENLCGCPPLLSWNFGLLPAPPPAPSPYRRDAIAIAGPSLTRPRGILADSTRPRT